MFTLSVLLRVLILYGYIAESTNGACVLTSLQYMQNETVQNSWFLFFISAIKAHLRWRYRNIVVRVITDDL